jgi:hypothetical protein
MWKGLTCARKIIEGATLLRLSDLTIYGALPISQLLPSA